jgi:hypothetical protein
VKKSSPTKGKATVAASDLIDARIKELRDWRGETLAQIRALIKQADPEVVEEWKWRGVPVWSHAGILCTGETYKNLVKITFLKGASLQNPSRLFNSSLEGNTRRAIDLHESDKIDEKAFRALIDAAVSLNTSTESPARLMDSGVRESKSRMRLATDAETDSIKAGFPPGIARPALRALHAAGFKQIHELSRISESEIAELHGMGPKAIATLRDALDAQGLGFRV